jgi:diphosphomevalonate decarboxylase
MGGYVAWRAGTALDGTDSLAEEVAPASYWPEMRALILVVSADKKAVGSTVGMQTTVQTSQLFTSRLEVVPARMVEMEKAISEKDFETFARITMQDSNTFHACCLDSWPPIQYLNDVSKAAMDAVNSINRKAGKLICAYTFDAGPNAVIYYLEADTQRVAGLFRHILLNTEGWEGEYGGLDVIQPNELTGLEAKVLRTIKAGISRVICTGVGGAPEKVETHLVDEKGVAVEV